VAQYFENLHYDEPFEPLPGVTARLVDAGHILGSASVELEIKEKGRKVSLWFSGDIGRRRLPLLRDPVLPTHADYMIMESTYGDKPHRDPEVAYVELRQVVSRTLGRGGKIIIPAFAVGRTQELVYYLHQMVENREIPSVPVYVDSPLAVNATDIFSKHVDCFDAETQDFILHDRHRAALGFDRLVYTRSVEESKALNDRKEPMVIISARAWLKTAHSAPPAQQYRRPRNTVLIVSGRRLIPASRPWPTVKSTSRFRRDLPPPG
jgi:metallo-beta-lactamase family protein